MTNKRKLWDRVLAWVLTLVMVFGMMPSLPLTVHAAADELTVTIDTGGSVTLKDNDGDGYYEIGTADELYAFAAEVNGGNSAINGELTADITVNENVLTDEGELNSSATLRVWTPIGNGSNKFTGTFDGADHTISGLYFHDEGEDYVGLFAFVGMGGAVQNAGVADSYFCGFFYVGGIVGYNEGGKVTNCINSGAVDGQYNIGGVVGYNASGTVTDCINSGAVDGQYNIGGVVGYNDGEVTDCINSGAVDGQYNIGGVVGNNYNGTVTGCSNSGAVDGDYVGGVVGYNASGTVTGSTNSGDVTGSGDYVGGVVGNNYNGTVTGCSNSGAVTGNSYVGGVAGYNEGGEVTGSSNSGAVTGSGNYVGGVVGNNYNGTVTGSSNSGAVTGSNYYVGGVVGYSDRGTVTDCINSGTVDGNYVGGVVGYNASGTVTGSTNSGDVTGSGDYVGGVVGANSVGKLMGSSNSGAVTGNSYVGGVAGDNYNGTVTGCYYLDDGETVLGGIDGADVTGEAEAGTTEQFASGELACALQAAIPEEDVLDEEGNVVGTVIPQIWGQNIDGQGDRDACPVPGGPKVYYGYLSCADDAEMVYTNNANASAEKPAHTSEPSCTLSDDGTQHTATWFCCGTTVTEDHTPDETVGQTCRGYKCAVCSAWFGEVDANKHDAVYTAEGNVITESCSLCEAVLATAAVTAANATYDGTAKETATVAYSDGWSGGEVTVSYENNTNAGTATAQITLGEATASATFTIEPKELTLSLTSYGKEYDGTNILTSYEAEVVGFIFYDEGDYESDVLDYDDVYDEVNLDTDKAVVTLSGCTVGEYTTAMVTSITLIGEDAGNYTIAAELEDVPLEGKYDTFAIYPMTLYITPDNQIVTEGQEISQTAYTLSAELPAGHTLSGVELVESADGKTISVAKDENYNIVGVTITNAQGEDVTGCFDVNSSETGNITRTHEGHTLNADGFCATGECSNYQSAVYNEDEGVYEISTAGQLYWFANYVNTESSEASAVLMNDIVIPKTKSQGGIVPDWTPIEGLYGSFDGNGKTVSGLYCVTEGNAGFIGSGGWWLDIYDLTIADSIIQGTDNVGAIVGSMNNGSVTNCVVTDTVTVSGTSYTTGGIAGYAGGTTVEYCIGLAQFADTESYGGLIGGGYANISSCFTNASEAFCSFNTDYGSAENVYYFGTADSEDYVDGTTPKTIKQFASGEVAYLLQSGVAEEDIYDEEGNYVETAIPHIWGQTVGTDTYPVFGGKKVYQIANTGCTAQGEYGYSNEKNTVFAPDHSFPEGSNGFCAVCDKGYEPAVLVNGVYQISNAGQLYWFADFANADWDNLKADAILMADIHINTDVLSEDGALNGSGEGFRTWTPIGTGSYGYEGTFDGNGKTISGLYFNDSSAHYVGLFGSLTGGTVQDLGVIRSYFSGETNVGSVVGYNRGTVTNCYNTGTVTGSSIVGGVVGYSDSGGTVANCYNSGAVTGNSTVGGVVGTSYGTTKDCNNSGTVEGTMYVGGVVSYSNGTTENCYNTGSVTGSDYVGGVVSYNGVSDIVSGCYNSGTVTGNSTVGGVVGYNRSSATVTGCFNSGTVLGSGSDVGGVAGQNSGATVSQCYNFGTVTGQANVGGVVGYVNGTNAAVTDCYNLGEVKGDGSVGGVVGRSYGSGTTVTGCYNTGKVIGTSKYVGGVVGYIYDATFTNCYYLSGCAADGDGVTQFGIGCSDLGSTTEDVTGQTEAKTEAQFTSGEVTYLLQGDRGEQVWGQDIDNGETPESYPVFSDAKVYEVTGCNGNTAYSNTNENLSHNYVNGFCTACGGYQPAVLNDEGVYEIANAGQLYWFAGLVNGTLTGINLNTGAKALLTADITVNTGVLKADGTLNEGEFREWTPIGNGTYSYNGSFDGNGKTVSGLYFNNSETNCVGLVGILDDAGTVQNVTVADSFLNGNTVVGGVAGGNDGLVRNCSYRGTVSGQKQIGGVVGNNDGSLENCFSEGSVSGSGNMIGGVAGNNPGTVSDCRHDGSVSGINQIGGVVGLSNGTVTGCSHTGSVKGSTYVGGVIGLMDAKGTVKNSYNTGTVTGTTSETGGVVGQNAGTVTDCYNTGSVSGSDSVGGVVGYSNNGKLIENCYNTGNLTGSKRVGGVVGRNTYNAVTNCYFDSDRYTGDAFGSFSSCTITNVAGKTSEAFASGEVAYLLNGDQTTIVFKQTIGTDAVPNFTGGTVYQVTNCKNETVYSNTNENIGHNWENSTCTVCGEPCEHAGEDGFCTECGVSGYMAYAVSGENIDIVIVPGLKESSFIVEGQDCVVRIEVYDGYIGPTNLKVLVGGTEFHDFCIASGTLTIPAAQITGSIEISASVEKADDPEHKVHMYWGLPSFNWDENYSCTATWTCAWNDCTVTNTESCTVTSETTAADCLTAAKTVYTAAVTLGNVTYTDVTTVTGETDPNNHSYTTNTCCGYCGAEGDGTNVTWTLVDGVLTLSGAGSMVDYNDIFSIPWHNKRSSISSVSIAEGLTNIGMRTFLAFDNLKNVTIPASVEVLGDYAFADCDTLENVTFAEGLTTIGKHAFHYCCALTEIAIPVSVERIGEEAFYGCTALTTVNAPCSWNENALYIFGDGVTVNIAGHIYENGVCTGCGAPDPSIPGVTASQATLMLEDEVSINIYFTVANLNVGTENMGLLAWDEEPEDPSYENADHRYGDVSTCGERFKVSTDPIAAKNMGDTKYYMVYAQAEDGTYYYSHVFPYSPKMYAMSRLEDSTDENLQKLCVALLNYGAEAQKYFASTTDYEYTELMNAELTDEQKAYVEAYREDMVPAVAPADASKVGSFAATANSFTSKKATVTLGGALAVNFYMVPGNATDSMTLYYWSAADYDAATELTADNATGIYEMELTEDGRFRGSVQEIAAKNMADTVYVCAVYEADGVIHSTGVIAYSIGKYCVNKAATASDVQDLAQATAVYGYYAREYFNNQANAG